MHRRTTYKVLIFLFVQLLTLASAQDQPSPRRKIGVALSGGGARGLAHIGVLQWMYENRIPVDYLAGTSMGGLVGAMYATGMSPEEMNDFVAHIDWDEALLSEPSYSELSFRRKEDRDDYEVGIPLGLKHGLSGPNGFTPGQGVGLILDRLSFPYSTISSFDDLPTPFRCVATDMLTGHAVILKDGSLAQALRATMSVPGIFTPVELNGKILADGGLVDNIPTDVVRDMHPDVVIAVNIGTPLAGREALESLSGLLVQTISVMTIAAERRGLSLADQVVSPDLGTYTAIDYGKFREIIRLGYEGAAKNADALRPFALSEADWQQYLADRASRRRTPEKQAEFVKVTGAGPDEHRLKKQVEKATQGQLNLPHLETKLTRIIGEGRFDALDYEGFAQRGVPGLLIKAHEKTYGPPFLDLALNVEGSGVGAFDFSAGGRITFMDVRGRGEWRNDLLLGSSDLAATEYYQPIAGSHFFVAPYAFFSKAARNAFIGNVRTAVYHDERGGGGFDIGYNTGRRSELRVGYEIFNGDLAPLIGDAGLPTINGDSGELRLRYTFAGQDSPTIPSKGVRLVLNLSHVFNSPGTTSYIDQAELQSTTFVPVSPKTSIFLAASGGTTFRRDAGPFQVFNLGGPFQLGAYSTDQFLGNHFGYLSLGFRRELYKLPSLVGKKIYWGGWYEAGSAFNSPSSVQVLGSINLGIIADTIVGPIALGGAVSPTGQTKVNFSIGRLFQF
ncbi:MAG TPA: patatin-like phospholipase family protein [Terriglobales bacterium]|nr:patatin-like phospholipase family protein [Terriglobales bacterium]